MKNQLFLLFAGFGLPFSVAFGQENAEPTDNAWNLVSIGVNRTYGAEKYFEPISFRYFRNNSPQTDPKYFTMPQGAADNTYREVFDIDPFGLGIQLTWPVGVKYNELRAGFAFQKHYNQASAEAEFFSDPNTLTVQYIKLREDYTIANATLDLVLEAAPIGNMLQFFWSGGVILGIASDQDLTFYEERTDIAKSDLVFYPDGSYSYNRQNGQNHVSTAVLGTHSHLEAGLRTSAGAELQLNIFKQKMGFSGEMGLGLIGQQVMHGGTGSLKRTEFGMLRVRYFLQ